MSHFFHIANLAAVIMLIAAAVVPAQAESRRALIVACTKYDHPAIKPLRGPEHDAPAFAEMLIRRFGFSAEEITILSEAAGVNDKTRRPTRPNIQRGFEDLEAKAAPGDAVVILLAGHGSRQPAREPQHQRYPKPDGLEGIFLPADVGEWNAAGPVKSVKNAIVEYELRDWCQAITARRARLWLTVDACQSAMSLRSDAEDVVRAVDPADLGIPAATSVTRGGHEFSGLALSGDPPDFAAIYAALPHEPAQEGAFASDGKVHGYLTYGLIEALLAAREPLTYRELATAARKKLAYYEHDQHPVAEGLARDKVVLDHRQQRQPDPVLSGDQRGGWRINLGALQGAAEGSIFEILPSPTAKDPAATIGFVRVTKSGLFESVVEPCPFTPRDQELAAVPAEKLKNGQRARPVYLAFGELKLRVAFSEVGPNGRPANRLNQLRQLAVALEARQRTRGLPVRRVGLNEQPEWIVQERTAGLVLLPAGVAQLSELPPDIKVTALPNSGTSEFLLARLAQIARAANLLKLADRQPLLSSLAGETLPVKLELVRLRDEQDYQGEPIPPTSEHTIQVNELIGWRITNESQSNVDVTLLQVDQDQETIATFPRPGGSDNRLSYEPGKNSVLAARARAKRSLQRPEQMVLIAVESPDTVPVEFTAFASKTMEAVRSAQVRGAEQYTVDSPLGELLQAALYDATDVRGNPSAAFGRARIAQVSWRIVPPLVGPTADKRP